MMKYIVSSSIQVPRRGRDEVYVAAVPLRATKGPAQLLMSSAYTLNLWDLQHFMVLIKPTSPPPSQPQDPENVYVALAALSGRKVPGALLTRNLTKLPKTKCWFVGYSRVDALDEAYKFNASWDTELSVGHHDCRDYTNGLVEYLMGEKCVLEKLRSSSFS